MPMPFRASGEEAGMTLAIVPYAPMGGANRAEEEAKARRIRNEGKDQILIKVETDPDAIGQKLAQELNLDYRHGKLGVWPTNLRRQLDKAATISILVIGYVIIKWLSANWGCYDECKPFGFDNLLTLGIDDVLMVIPLLFTFLVFSEAHIWQIEFQQDERHPHETFVTIERYGSSGYRNFDEALIDKIIGIITDNFHVLVQDEVR